MDVVEFENVGDHKDGPARKRPRTDASEADTKRKASSTPTPTPTTSADTEWARIARWGDGYWRVSLKPNKAQPAAHCGTVAAHFRGVIEYFDKYVGQYAHLVRVEGKRPRDKVWQRRSGKELRADIEERLAEFEAAAQGKAEGKKRWRAIKQAQCFNLGWRMNGDYDAKTDTFEWRLMAVDFDGPTAKTPAHAQAFCDAITKDTGIPLTVAELNNTVVQDTPGGLHRVYLWPEDAPVVLNRSGAKTATFAPIGMPDVDTRGETTHCVAAGSRHVCVSNAEHQASEAEREAKGGKWPIDPACKKDPCTKRGLWYTFADSHTPVQSLARLGTGCAIAKCPPAIVAYLTKHASKAGAKKKKKPARDGKDAKDTDADADPAAVPAGPADAGTVTLVPYNDLVMATTATGDADWNDADDRKHIEGMFRRGLDRTVPLGHGNWLSLMLAAQKMGVPLSVVKDFVKKCPDYKPSYDDENDALWAADAASGKLEGQWTGIGALHKLMKAQRGDDEYAQLMKAIPDRKQREVPVPRPGRFDASDPYCNFDLIEQMCCSRPHATIDEARQLLRDNAYRVMAVIDSTIIVKLRPQQAIVRRLKAGASAIDGMDAVKVYTQKEWPNVTIKSVTWLKPDGTPAAPVRFHKFVQDNYLCLPFYESYTWNPRKNHLATYVDCTAFNTFGGLRAPMLADDVPVRVGAIAPIIELVRDVLCNGDLALFDNVMVWHYLMLTGQKARRCLFWYSEKQQTAGKSLYHSQFLLQRVIGLALGVQLQGVKPATEKFNSALAEKLFVFFDEAEPDKAGDNSQANAIKFGGTENIQMVRRLYAEAKAQESPTASVLAANKEPSIEFITKRFEVQECGERGPAYFATLAAFLIGDPDAPSHWLTSILRLPRLPRWPEMLETYQAGPADTALRRAIIAKSQSHEAAFIDLVLKPPKDGGGFSYTTLSLEGEEKVRLVRGGNALASELHAAYLEWCRGQNIKATKPLNVFCRTAKHMLGEPQHTRAGQLYKLVPLVEQDKGDKKAAKN